MEHIKLGKYNQLEVLRKADFGVYLDGKDDDDILLPLKEVPEGTEEGDILNVFVYLDQQERLIATTIVPKVQVGRFACLKVSWVNEYGAFLDWGLMKDLFVPFREQKAKMKVGGHYVIYCYEDKQTHRITASAKIEHFLAQAPISSYEPGDEVDLLIWQQTDLGYKVIIDNTYGGLIYEDEIFTPVEIGEFTTGYIKQVREDGKIDVALQPSGRANVVSFSDKLLAYLKEHEGHTSFNDHSSADAISREFGVSKKTFKKGVGELYKKRLIEVTDNGLSLAKHAPQRHLKPNRGPFSRKSD